MGRVASALVIAAAIAAHAAPARADDKARAAELYELGSRLFAAEQYAEAARLFAESYQLDALPAALFNQARCLEESGQTEKAAGAFRAYLEADPDGPGATEAEARLLALERALEQRREREAAKERARREAAERARQARATKMVEVDRGRTLRLAGYITAGAGVAATITGVIFGARASRLAGDLETPREQWTDADVDAFNSGVFAERMQIGLLIGGGVAIITGAVLATIGHQRSSVLEVRPVISPDSSGATVTVRF